MRMDIPSPHPAPTKKPSGSAPASRIIPAGMIYATAARHRLAVRSFCGYGAVVVRRSEDEVARQRRVQENTERDDDGADGEDHQQESINDDRDVLPRHAVRRPAVLPLLAAFPAIQRLADTRQRPRQPPLQLLRPAAARRRRPGRVTPTSVSGSGFPVALDLRLGSRRRVAKFAVGAVLCGVSL